MCTVTWLRTPGAYDLFFNRDEKRTRLLAEPPSCHALGEVAAIYPVDADAGGSWLGVNAYGLTLALLNFYSASLRSPAKGRVSRGHLLLALLDAASAADAMERVAGTELTDYAPFLLLALDPAGPPALLRWTGSGVPRPEEQAQSFLTTSSYREADVTAARRQQYERLAAARAPLTVADLEAFHASEEPEPGPFAVCMSREDAATVSYSHVHVGPEGVRFTYTDGPPGHVQPGLPVALERA